MNASIIFQYFPNLSETQRKQFEALEALYVDWNAKINVISRKDIERLYEHHVLHSLGIAKAVPFTDGLKILDVGTGGGFPGIPLAILYPTCHFKLIDSIGKKIRVASEVAKSIGLTNIEIEHRNAKEEKGKYDYVVSRAVMLAPELMKLIRKNIKPIIHEGVKGGLICLKGGDVEQEVDAFAEKSKIWNLSEWFDTDFFTTKKVVYISL